MVENRKRKSTIPMGVFCPTTDRNFERSIRREETFDRGHSCTKSDEIKKRAVLDVSFDQSESERDAAASSVIEESEVTVLESDDSIGETTGDVGEPKSGETRDPTTTQTADTVSRDSRPSDEDGNPLEIVVEKMDKFAVRVSQQPRARERSNFEVNSNDCARDDAYTTDAATDLGNAMKALLDNRNQSEWDNFVRVGCEADTDGPRQEREPKASDTAQEADDAKLSRVSTLIQIPDDESAIAEPLIVVEPCDVEPINSLAPLEASNVPQPRMPLIRGGVAGAATAIVLLAATTWAVIENQHSQPATRQRTRPESTTESMVHAQVLPAAASRIVRLESRADHQSDRRADAKAVERQTDRRKNPKAKLSNRRSKRAVISKRRDEPQIKATAALLSESAVAQSEPVEAVQEPISPQEPLPQIPSREAVIAALTSLRAQVRQCVSHTVGVAQLDITIKNSGRVSHVIVNGDFRGTKQGSCIARVVRKARFKSFKQPEFRVLFPYAF